MPACDGKRPIAVVSACMTAQGIPTFALNQVEVTPAEAADGIHYYLVEADLLLAGYEEPFVHFAEGEGPAFLHSAVRQHLCLPAVPNHMTIALGEDRYGARH